MIDLYADSIPQEYLVVVTVVTTSERLRNGFPDEKHLADIVTWCARNEVNAEYVEFMDKTSFTSKGVYQQRDLWSIKDPAQRTMFILRWCGK